MASFDPKALLAQLRDPRFLNWKSGVALAVLVAALWFLYRNTAAVLFTEENASSGYAIASALEEYRLNAGRYPEKLAELKPRYLAEIPRPAERSEERRVGKECRL